MTSPLHFARVEQQITETISFNDGYELAAWIKANVPDPAMRDKMMEEGVGNRKFYGKYFIRRKRHEVQETPTV
jgi:hypothetical protein